MNEVSKRQQIVLNPGPIGRQGNCKNAGAAGLTQERGSGRAYTRVREWQGLRKNAGEAWLM